jgi:hypothetical protein
LRVLCSVNGETSLENLSDPSDNEIWCLRKIVAQQ